jgi:hypothetical protein
MTMVEYVVKKWFIFAHILLMEPSGFAEVLKLQWERKNEFKELWKPLRLSVPFEKVEF